MDLLRRFFRCVLNLQGSEAGNTESCDVSQVQAEKECATKFPAWECRFPERGQHGVGIGCRKAFDECWAIDSSGQ